MKLESQVCSLELSKRLKELGVKQESLFYWTYTDAPLKDGSRDEIVLGLTLGDSHWELGGEIDTYSAFTVAELGEMMSENVVFRNYQKRFNGAWRINFGDIEFGEQTEANTRAGMLIYLLENSLITL